MQMKTSTLSLKPCSVCLQQRGFPLKRGRQLCRFQQFLFVAVHGCWELLPSCRMKLTPRHSRSGSHVVAKQMCSATDILLIWWALSCSQNGEHEQMPEESPEIAGRDTAFQLHTTLQSVLGPYGFAFPVPNPELLSANDLLSFTQGLLARNNCLIY